MGAAQRLSLALGLLATASLLSSPYVSGRAAPGTSLLVDTTSGLPPIKSQAGEPAAAVLISNIRAAASAAAAAAAGSSRLSLGPSDADLEVLEAALGYNWTDRWLLRQALIHPSFGEFNNDRLAWIGDAVLQAMVSDLAYQWLPPEASTEQLHEARVARVRCTACAAGARKLGLHRLLVVGKGYEGEEPTAHMLAEAFEAVWGALHVDQGFRMERAKEAYAQLFPQHLPLYLSEAAGLGCEPPS